MLKKWCEITSCNGVIDLYESKENKKHFLFWVVVTITMFACSIFFTYRTILGYIETPTVTNIDVVQQTIMELPEVVVSYNGVFNVTAMKDANFSEEFVHSLISYLGVKPTITNDPNPSKNRSMAELSLYLKNNHLDYIDFANRFRYECKEITISINQPDGSYYGCENSTSFITEKWSSFLIKNISSQWYPGLLGGLKLRLKQPKGSYAQLYPIEAAKLDLYNNFLISLEKTIGHYYHTARSLTIPLNARVEIVLNPKVYKRINGNRKCSESMFSSNTCFDQCLIYGIFKTCQCIPYVAFGDGVEYEQSQVCNPFIATTSCRNRNVTKLCNSKCLPSCNELVYEATTTFYIIDSTELNESTSIVYIGYNNMQYTKIEEMYAFTIDMAISNVGGQAGLWLGISFVTIIQAVYYLVLSISPKKEILASLKENNKEGMKKNVCTLCEGLTKRLDLIESNLKINDQSFY